jgi:hypothetical protein
MRLPISFKSLDPDVQIMEKALVRAHWELSNHVRGNLGLVTKFATGMHGRWLSAGSFLAFFAQGP